MAGRISLAVGLHNHQPVGNFGWVIEETFRRAYLPTVEALERHPAVRLALHYTGPLLEWLASEQPDFIDRVAALVARGQVEVLGGGLYEPVLASLPARDRVRQLERMAMLVEASFGVRPGTAWLAERVWEPDLPTALASASYRSVILDDAHLRAAAIPEDGMWGPYTTDDQGASVTVFGTEQGLRYRIPFQPVEDVIGYLRDHATTAGDRLGTMGDDGEKLGAWPDTWDHCWGATRWVEEFFEALEASRTWLSTTTFSDWLAEHPPLGRIYVPVGSYAEMGEWALPPDESRAFHEAVSAATAAGRPERRWLRGASWRNFQVRYREVNDLHKRMLRVSAAVESMAPGAARERAIDELLRGQSNDVYWHGLFGGIYLPHLRLATLGHLIAAEDAADSGPRPQPRTAVLDLDLDGHEEVRLGAIGQVVTIHLHEGGGVGDWDIRAARHGLASVLRRRPEAYHAALLAGSAVADSDVPSPGWATAAPAAGPGPASIHEVVRAKEAGLAGRLRYDDHERRSALIRFLPPDAGPADYGAGEVADAGTLLAAPQAIVELAEDRLVTGVRGHVILDGRPLPVVAERTIALAGGRRDPRLVATLRVTNASRQRLRCRLGQEWSLMLLGGGHNPAAWYQVGRRRSPHDAAGSAAAVRRLRQGNDWLGVELTTRLAPAADVWWAPIDTISNSEGGFERVYQGSAMLFSWRIDLGPGEAIEVAVDHAVTASRDGRSGPPSG